MWDTLRYHLLNTPGYGWLTIAFLGLLSFSRVKSKRVLWVWLCGLLLFQLWHYVQAVPGGLDVYILAYNSGLYLQGVDIFGLERLLYDTPAPYTHAQFLDYSPFQLFFYNLAVWLNGHFPQRVYGYAGWAFLHFAIQLLVLWGVYKTTEVDTEKGRQAFLCKALFVLVCPQVWLYSYALYWSDKVCFVAIPLLLLAYQNYPRLGGLVLGLGVAFNGSLLVAAPAYGLLQLKKRGIGVAGGMVVLAIATALVASLLVGQEAWIMFQNRATRMQTFKPGPSSLFYYLPKGVYFPAMVYMVQGLMGGLAIYLAVVRKNLRWALIVGVWAMLIVSPWNNLGRILPCVLIVPLTRAVADRGYYIGQGIAISLFWLFKGSTPGYWTVCLPLAAALVDVGFSLWKRPTPLNSVASRRTWPA